MSAPRPKRSARRASYQRYIRAGAGARRIRSRRRARGRRDGARNRHRAKPRHPRGLRRRTQCRQSLDARRFRAPGAGHGLVRVLRRPPDWSKQQTFVVWQPSAVKGAAAARRFRAARRVAGLSALPRHRSARRGAAARVRGLVLRTFMAHARRDAWTATQEAMSGTDRPDVRGAIFPGRAEGAREDHRRQRHRGFPRVASKP